MKRINILLLALLLTNFSGIVRGQPRKVLIEQFTNSGCPPCAANTPVVASYVNMHPDSVLMIAYHTSFPYQDSMYQENPVQSNSRVAYYNIVGVPRSVVDGNYFSGNLLSTINTTIPMRSAIPPRYLINFNSVIRNNSQVDISYTVESLDPGNLNEAIVAHTVLVEKNVLKSSYVCCAGANTENEYPWVMRSMLPDQSGTNLINKQVGGIDFITMTANAINFKNLNELRVIVFIQNIISKEVYQSEIIMPSNVTSIEDFNSEDSGNFFFPNPTNGQNLQLLFSGSENKRIIEITDMNGRLVFYKISGSQRVINLNLIDVKAGIYIISVSSSMNRKIKKLIIQ